MNTSAAGLLALAAVVTLAPVALASEGTKYSSRASRYQPLDIEGLTVLITGTGVDSTVRHSAIAC